MSSRQYAFVLWRLGNGLSLCCCSLGRKAFASQSRPPFRGGVRGCFPGSFFASTLGLAANQGGLVLSATPTPYLARYPIPTSRELTQSPSPKPSMRVVEQSSTFAR